MHTLTHTTITHPSPLHPHFVLSPQGSSKRERKGSSFLRYFPFCLGVGSSRKSGGSAHHDDDSDAEDYDLELRQIHGLGPHGSTAHTNNPALSHGNSHLHHLAATFPPGGLDGDHSGAVTVHYEVVNLTSHYPVPPSSTPSVIHSTTLLSPLMPYLKMQINALIYAPSHRFSTFAPLHLQGLDVIPEGVSDVLSYFFPSKLQHLLLTDVISLFSETTIDAHFAATAHVMKVALAAAAAADALTSAPPPTSTTTTAIDSNKDNERSMLDETNCLNPSPPPPLPLQPPPAHVSVSSASTPGPGSGPGTGTGPGLAPLIGITRMGRLRLPQQYPVNAVMMPVRTGAYLSFTRYGRVIERMIDVYEQQQQQQQKQQQQPQQEDKTHPYPSITIDNTAPRHTLPCCQQPWSLAFRDSNYAGDFHVSLLNTLRRCSSLVSVTFANSNKVIFYYLSWCYLLVIASFVVPPSPSHCCVRHLR